MRPRTSNQIINTALSYKTQALSTLGQFGFLEDHIDNWKGDFNETHIRVLLNLCNNESSLEEAIKKVKSLKEHQLEGLLSGLIYEDVIGLNDQQICTLELLKDHGLTAKHLRAWKGGFFEHGHRKVLCRLIRDEKKTPEEAIREIELLKGCEALAVAKGFNYQDILGFYEEQINALIILRHRGVTPAQLRSWVSEGQRFHYSHQRAIKYLIIERRFSVEDAIKEINGLRQFEAHGIANGLFYAEVKGLPDEQIQIAITARQIELEQERNKEFEDSIKNYRPQELNISIADAFYFSL